MPTASLRVLKDFFERHLHFTPTQADIELFEADLSVVSPSLMHAALREVSASGKLKSGRAADWRRAIFTVYHRKVAEHAQLFPVFHCFETAFRSTMAVTLEGHYTLQRWWEPIGAAIQSGNAPRSVAAIQGQAVPSDAAHAIGNAVHHLIENGDYATTRNGYEFAERCKFSHIGAIIAQHWHVFGPALNAHRRITQADFQAKFRRVREARNDVYHHRSFSGMRDVYANAEELLDALNCSLCLFHSGVLATKPATPTFTVAVAARHNPA